VRLLDYLLCIPALLLVTVLILGERHPVLAGYWVIPIFFFCMDMFLYAVGAWAFGATRKRGRAATTKYVVWIIVDAIPLLIAGVRAYGAR
jgi:hypothetical protein